MKTFRKITDFREWRRSVHAGSVGFVPTMGALHDGHGSLVATARRDNAHVAVSLFVNPTQFNDPNDLKNYPRPEDEDLRKLESWGVDAVLIPEGQEMYRDHYRFEVSECDTSRILCGAHRPGHFQGVLTVVMKLFWIVRPDRAYFGEKDYQQLRLISEMADAFHMAVEVVPCPTVREADGLAMSSRNVRLTSDQREFAARLPGVLRQAANADAAAADLKRLGFNVEYVADLWGRRLAAVHVGKVRLIDNVEL